MVKAGFLKTIKNNMSFKNFFILLGLLIILSIVLFSSYNKYSIENFTPKPNARLEIILWTGTDISGSKQNHNFIINDWFTLVNTYHQMPNIKFAKITTSAASDINSEFRKWAKLETGNPEVLAANADTKYPWDKITFPGITIRLIETNNNTTSYTLITSYWHTLGNLTLLDVTNGVKRIMVGEYYDRLYEKNISAQQPQSGAPSKNSVIKL
jgi:hypothetical protein